MPKNKVKNVTTDGFSLLNGVNIALNKPLALPIEMAINETINNTNGSNVLNVDTGEERIYFIPSSEKMLFTVTTDVSKEALFIFVISP